jgi:tetratricopeptide (TPR) repeat protein
MQVKKSSISIKKCCWFCLLVLTVISSKAQAGDIHAALWNKANQFYTQKKYDSAALAYEQLLKSNNSNATLQYNTGNAYYRLNKIGLAILHYEKAAHLQPDNKEIRENLQLAKSKVQDNMTVSNPIFFVSWWNALNHVVSPNVWAVAALLMFMVVLALIYLTRSRKDGFANAGRWVSLAIVCLLICGSMAWISYDGYAHPNKVVVIKGGGLFLQTPQSNGKVIGSLPEGLILDILGKQGAYYKVELQNGKSGWVVADAIGEV